MNFRWPRLSKLRRRGLVAVLVVGLTAVFCRMHFRQVYDPEVSNIIHELRNCRYSCFHDRAFSWQTEYLPRSLWYIPEQDNYAPRVAELAQRLSNHGQAARPAIRDLIQASRRSELHFIHWLDVVHALIDLGPAARDALPFLREVAADPTISTCVEAGLAIYRIEGTTADLERIFAAKQSSSDGFRDCYFALAYFSDETVDNLLWPWLRDAVQDESRSKGERSLMIFYVRNLVATSPAARQLVEKIASESPHEELRSEARKALRAAAGELE
jgi:hypothetical protein